MTRLRFLLLGLVVAAPLAARPPLAPGASLLPPAAPRSSAEADGPGLPVGAPSHGLPPGTVRVPAPSLPAGPRVVLLVRHAEVAPDGSPDPPLSAAGRQRAEALARIAASFDVEAAFVTPFRRTTDTAGPAADWLGLKPEAVPIPAGGVPAHVADLAARVRNASGGAALVVGHSNTVPAVILALTGQDVGPIAEDEFDRLFIVTLPADGPATVEERTY